MKCEAMVRRVESGKKKKYQKITHIFSMWHIVVQKLSMNSDGPGKWNTYEESEFKKCDGNIKATVSIEVDDGCSCCGNTYISIEYKCDKCKNTSFQELPQDENGLSKFLTESIANISKSKRNDMLDEEQKKEIKHQKWLEEMIKNRRYK